MQLAMTVVLLVVCVTALMGAAGYLIDRSAARHERNEDR
jgi:hypothetical protein